MTLNAAVGAAGHSPNTGSSQSFNYVSVAAERGHGTPWKTPAGEQINLHWQLVYTDFLGSLDLDPRPENVISVDRSWQLSAAIARADQPIRLWLLKFDRLGIGYQFSPSSDYKGVKFFLRAFYDL